MLVLCQPISLLMGSGLHQVQKIKLSVCGMYLQECRSSHPYLVTKQELHGWGTPQMELTLYHAPEIRAFVCGMPIMGLKYFIHCMSVRLVSHLLHSPQMVVVLYQ